MKLNQFSKCLSFVLFLVGVSFNSGCHEIKTYNYSGVHDVFCDGKNVSAVIAHRTKIVAEPQMADQHGYLVSKTNDSWLVTWSVKDVEKTINKPVTQYIGRSEHERSQNGSKIVKNTGLFPGTIRGLSNPNVLLQCYEDLKVLKNGVEQKLDVSIQETHLKRFIFTRSRQHVFSWLPEPAIYSIPDLKLVKKVETTQTFADFEKLFMNNGVVNRILTEDLSNLIGIPDGVKPIHQFTKAYCFNISQDQLSTIQLNNVEQGRIYDAEVIEGELNWLVQHFIEKKRKWLILDSDSCIISEISLPARPEFYSRPTFWQPNHDLLWMVQAPEPDVWQVDKKPKYSIFKYNLKDGTHVQLELPASDELVVPK